MGAAIMTRVFRALGGRGSRVSTAAALGAIIASSSCVNQNVAAETVTWQASQDFDCAPSNVTIKEIRLQIYYAAGCNQARQYQVSGACTKDSNCIAGDVRGMGKGVGP